MDIEWIPLFLFLPNERLKKMKSRIIKRKDTDGKAEFPALYKFEAGGQWFIAMMTGENTGMVLKSKHVLWVAGDFSDNFLNVNHDSWTRLKDGLLLTND